MEVPDDQCSGMLPNVHWQAVELEDLRQLRNFEALPPADWVHVAGSPSYRYVRQESPLWSALHQGVLTTGSLPQSLGFFEPLSIRKLGLPRSRASHRHLLDAYHRLLLPPPTPSMRDSCCGCPAASATGPVQATEGETWQCASPSCPACALEQAAAEEHNVAAVARFNAAKLDCSGLRDCALVHGREGGGAGVLGHAACAAPSAALHGAARVQVGNVGSASPCCSGGEAGGGERGAGETSNTKKTKKLKKKAKPKAGSEGSGVLVGNRSLPSGAVAHPERGGPRWSGQPEPTPPARPEGIPVAWERAGKGGTGAVTGAGEGGGAPRGRDAVGEAGKLRLARRLAQEGVGSICCAWGKAQEGASLYALAALLPSSSRVIEVGLYQPDSQALALALGLPPGALPPLGASPDALLRHAVPGDAGQDSGGRGWCETLTSGGGSGEGGGWEEKGTAGAGVVGGNLPRSSTVMMGGERYVFEAVEVKNACPFADAQRRGGGSSRRSAPYQLSDRGPRLTVKPEWVPQLQMHMLCSGTHSLVLLSRSATRGLHLFRVWRDDAYLELMLRVLSRFWREHVQRRRPPPTDMFASCPQYHALLSRTLLVAQGAELVLAAPQYAHPPHGDPRLFLD